MVKDKQNQMNKTKNEWYIQYKYGRRTRDPFCPPP